MILYGTAGPYILVDSDGSGELNAIGPFAHEGVLWERVERVWPKHWIQPTKHHIADVVDPEYGAEQIAEGLEEEAEEEAAARREEAGGDGEH